MKLTKLELTLDFGYCNSKTMDVSISSREELLGTFINHQGTLTVKKEIKLPNTLTINVSNKNYGTDTILNYDNTIAQNKYVELKQLRLGGIKWDTAKLFHLCSYQSDCDKNLINTTFWDKNGTITIDFFDKDFIQFHLHYQNLFKLYT